MLHSRKLLAATAIALALFAGPKAQAETPADTLIMAWNIDDIISLDPAEIFEFSAAEIAGNSYQRLVNYDVKDVSKIYGEAAESWTVSDDGKTFTFTLRAGNTFASGNPMTAADAVYSLVRAVKLDKSPAFILGQFGLTPDNVEDKIKQTGDLTFTFETDQAYAPTFVLYCMTATVSSVVDKKLVQEHEANGDWGYDWLKTNYAGSGPFTIREWRANEAVIMERNDNYNGDKPSLARAIYQHVPEGATQRLLLEQGDVDIARNLSAEEMTALEGNPDIKIETGPKGSIWYMGLNQKNADLAKPEVREAMKYLVDYSAIADTIMKGKVKVHQAFLPSGFLGAVDDNPYSYDPAKAKELLAKAGLPDGFSVTMDVRSSGDTPAIAEAIQQTMASGGIKMELIPGDGGQVLTKYRARNHDIYIGQWGPDYQDPNTNADTFAANSDNSDDASAKPLAWRNAWDIPEMTEKTKAAVLEKDAAKRAQMYEELQREHQQVSPFVIMFQQIEVWGIRKNVDGIIIGPSFDTNYFYKATKN
jgi:peptide/nickel transport system substrate-binding protein